MEITICPSRLDGHIKAPASKSIMQRACAAALLSSKKTVINNPGNSNDDIVSINIIKQLGAKVVQLSDNTLSIESAFVSDFNRIFSKENAINCGESGLSARMFTMIAALCHNKIKIYGHGSLLNRPFSFFDNVFPKLGVKFQSNTGKLPFEMQGPIKIPKHIVIDGSISSQFLTGLLFAYSVALNAIKSESEFIIEVTNLKSKPYIDLTLQVMRHFGLTTPNHVDYHKFIFHQNKAITPTKNTNGIVEFTVEGDWSSASFLMVAGAIAGPITITGLNPKSLQADKHILEALEKAYVKMLMDSEGIHITPSQLTAFDFDATDCPDLFPPLVALAAYCNGVSKIKGVHRLINKESNRSLTLLQEFSKMGLKIEMEDDWMFINGQNKLKGAIINSRNDHRIAMACAVAALNAEGETTIVDSSVVDKSYPDFFKHLELLGAQIINHDN